MKAHSPGDLRNFAIVGHASSGKTMLAECMLRCAGVINRLGRIADGSTMSDYHPGEIKRQISIHATPLHCEWMGRKFNLIDTPGYLDFLSEGLGALRVGDFALIVVHAAHGVGVGTEKVWEYASRFQIPKMVVVNALDKDNGDFARVLAQLRERFGPRLFPMNLPINPGPGFNQVLDVLRSEVVTYPADASGQYSEVPAAGEWKERVDQLHKELIEHIAEADDTLLNKFFDQGTLSEEELRSGVHAAIQREAFTPVFCTAAENNIGVARLMDFIAKYGSSPVDRETVTAHDADGREVEVHLNDPDPTLYVFKTSSEPHVGELSFFRLYSGEVHVGSGLYNSDRKIIERVGQMFLLNGKTREHAASLRAGDIGAVVKLRDTHTGNTLCSEKHPVTLPKVIYPQPNIHAALKSASKGDEDKIAAGLAALHEEDPTFLYRVDGELHQTVISGQGELHLQVLNDRLKRRYNVELQLAEPRIPYRETIRAKADAKYRHKKQTGGAGQFAEVWMRIEPSARDSGVEFTQSLTGQNVDRGFVPSVEKGVNAAMHEGVIAGYRVTDVRVDFYDGKMHTVDSNDIAFQIAGKAAFKEAFENARPCLLEPIYNVEIKAPEDNMGAVLGDLSAHRGKILSMEADGHFQIIQAQLPQKELYQYATRLRSLTGGRGFHTEKFSHYEEMPREMEAKVIAESKARRGEV
jgi:elongation factor G